MRSSLPPPPGGPRPVQLFPNVLTACPSTAIDDGAESEAIGSSAALIGLRGSRAVEDDAPSVAVDRLPRRWDESEKGMADWQLRRHGVLLKTLLPAVC